MIWRQKVDPHNDIDNNDDIDGGGGDEHRLKYLHVFSTK